jgi:hypothetical protein
MKVTVLSYQFTTGYFEVQIDGRLYWADIRMGIFNPNGDLLHHACPSIVDIHATRHTNMLDVSHYCIDFYAARFEAPQAA